MRLHRLFSLIDIDKQKIISYNKTNVMQRMLRNDFERMMEMPPKPKYTKEEVVKVALDMVREQGVDSLTARDLGAKLGTSSRPIFTAFENMNGKLKIVAKDRAKTKSSLRALPLDAGIKKRLLEIKAQQEAYQKKFKRSYSKDWAGYVMVDELGGLILPNYITSAFKHLLKKNELRVIRYHDLRHTCASLLLNKGKTNGVTLKDIQVWLGHSDFSTTANTYSHLDANSKFSSLNTLAGVVNL